MDDTIKSDVRLILRALIGLGMHCGDYDNPPELDDDEIRALGRLAVSVGIKEAPSLEERLTKELKAYDEIRGRVSEGLSRYRIDCSGIEQVENDPK